MTSWKGIWFHVAGIIAIIWFLIRVVPNTSTSTISLSTGRYFNFTWIYRILEYFVHRPCDMAAKREDKIRENNTNSLRRFCCFVHDHWCCVCHELFPRKRATSGISWDPIPKQPMGVGTGVNPGRVVWVWNPNATEEDLAGYWWEQENNNQDVIDQMFSIGVQELTGTSTDSDAWNAIFSYFNEVHGNGNIGYQPGEKIAIKMNLNNALGGVGDPYVKEDNDRDASPYVVKALLHQLVNVVGVAQEDITVFDASRPITNCLYNRIYYENYPADPLVEEFSQIHYVDSSWRGNWS